MRFAFVVLFLALALAPSGGAENITLTVRGFGTAVVDGDLAPGEWDQAGRYDFQANRALSEGGGAVPASFYVMNDATNLYLALRVSVTNFGYSAFDSVFNAPGPNPFAAGGDILRVLPTYWEDMHYHQTSPFEWSWLPDVMDGGPRTAQLQRKRTPVPSCTRSRTRSTRPTTGMTSASPSPGTSRSTPPSITASSRASPR